MTKDNEAKSDVITLGDLEKNPVLGTAVWDEHVANNPIHISREPDQSGSTAKAFNELVVDFEHEGRDWLSKPPAPQEYLFKWNPYMEENPNFSGLPGWMPRSHVCVLASPGGVGKSHILADMSLSICAGAAALGMLPTDPTSQRGVLYIAAEENSDVLRERLHKICNARAFTSKQRDEIIKRMVVVPGAGRSWQLVCDTKDGGQTNLFDTISAYIDDHRFTTLHHGWDAIIFDPLIRFGSALTETDNHQASRLIETLEHFTKKKGNPSVIAAHHMSQASSEYDSGGASGVRGVTGLVDGAREVIVVKDVSKNAVLDLHGGVDQEIERLKGNNTLGKPPTQLFQISVRKTNRTAALPPFFVTKTDDGCFKPPTPEILKAWKKENPPKKEYEKRKGANSEPDKKPEGRKEKRLGVGDDKVGVRDVPISGGRGQ